MSDTDSLDIAPLVAYFAAFSPFTYQPTQSAGDNFKRLCEICGWAKKSTEQLSARQNFKDALVLEFNFIYGTDENDLNAWHNLCKAINIDPLPDTVVDCRIRVGGAHVNIVDLLDTYNTGCRVQTFASLEELAEYTMTTGRFFPRANAYQGGLLKELLREILRAYYGKRRNGSRRKRMRRARKRAAATGGTTQPSV